MENSHVRFWYIPHSLPVCNISKEIAQYLENSSRSYPMSSVWQSWSERYNDNVVVKILCSTLKGVDLILATSPDIENYNNDSCLLYMFQKQFPGISCDGFRMS